MINPAYQESWSQAKDVLAQEGFVLLANILTDDAYNKLLEHVTQQSFEEEYNPAHERISVGLVSDEMHTLIDKLSDHLDLADMSRFQLIKYEKGSYVLQDAQKQTSGYTIIVFLGGEEWQQEYRGEHTFLREDQEPLYIPPQPNSALILKREETDALFVKRVTHHADNESYVAIEARNQ